MESRLNLIVRFLTHFCEATGVISVKPNVPVGRVSEQVVQIRAAVNRYFITYFACESINQMKVEDLEAFGVNTPVIFGVLDELGAYLTKHGDESAAHFIERHQTYYSFEGLGDNSAQVQTIKMMASQLFFAFHFIMQKMCPNRAEKKLKAAAAQSMVDHTLVEQLLKHSLIKERKASEAEVENEDVMNQIKTFFSEVLQQGEDSIRSPMFAMPPPPPPPPPILDGFGVARNLELPNQSADSASSPAELSVAPVKPALSLRVKLSGKVNRQSPFAREKVVSARLTQSRLSRIGQQKH